MGVMEAKMFGLDIGMFVVLWVSGLFCIGKGLNVI